MRRNGHKYIWKERKNGEWRYYYDDDLKRDKGFSIKTPSRTTMSFSGNFGSGPSKSSKSYYVDMENNNLFGKKS